MHAVGCVVAAAERAYERNELRTNGQALNGQEALCESKAMLRTEQLVGNRHALTSVDPRTRIGKVFQELEQRYAEGRRDLRKASNAYADSPASARYRLIFAPINASMWLAAFGLAFCFGVRGAGKASSEFIA